jgi:hypothetical protein
VRNTGFGGWFPEGEGDGVGSTGGGVGPTVGPVTLTAVEHDADWPPALTAKDAV